MPYKLLLNQIEEVILVTQKQELEQKSEWFSGVKLFISTWNWSAKTVFEQ